MNLNDPRLTKIHYLAFELVLFIKLKILLRLKKIDTIFIVFYVAQKSNTVQRMLNLDFFSERKICSLLWSFKRSIYTSRSFINLKSKTFSGDILIIWGEIPFSGPLPYPSPGHSLDSLLNQPEKNRRYFVTQRKRN